MFEAGIEMALKILLTGSSGFIAGRIAEDLHSRGHLLRCVLRQVASKEFIKKIPKAEFFVGSFYDQAFCLRLAFILSLKIKKT